jgi:hypothetical protein
MAITSLKILKIKSFVIKSYFAKKRIAGSPIQQLMDYLLLIKQIRLLLQHRIRGITSHNSLEK